METFSAGWIRGGGIRGGRESAEADWELAQVVLFIRLKGLSSIHPHINVCPTVKSFCMWTGIPRKGRRRESQKAGSGAFFNVNGDVAINHIIKGNKLLNFFILYPEEKDAKEDLRLSLRIALPRMELERGRGSRQRRSWGDDRRNISDEAWSTTIPCEKKHVSGRQFPVKNFDGRQSPVENVDGRHTWEKLPVSMFLELLNIVLWLLKHRIKCGWTWDSGHQKRREFIPTWILQKILQRPNKG